MLNGKCYSPLQMYTMKLDCIIKDMQASFLNRGLDTPRSPFPRINLCSYPFAKVQQLGFRVLRTRL